MQNKTIIGVVHKTQQQISDKVYYNGTCSFTVQLPTPVLGGQYSYSVDFYPGSGKTTVDTLTVG